jgi:hypothetical protein
MVLLAVQNNFLWDNKRVAEPVYPVFASPDKHGFILQRCELLSVPLNVADCLHFSSPGVLSEPESGISPKQEPGGSQASPDLDPSPLVYALHQIALRNAAWQICDR